MAKKIEKTNVMRVLDQKKVPYIPYSFETKVAVSGVDAAQIMGKDPKTVYKTLVTSGASKEYYVFVIPSCAELDLKKAAKAVGEKSITMLPAKELLPLTGYIHGGCSPIGMKKIFRTVIQQDACSLEHFLFSAGKIGYQVELSPLDVKKVLLVEFADVTE